jgi:hypothetical protein
MYVYVCIYAAEYIYRFIGIYSSKTIPLGTQEVHIYIHTCIHVHIYINLHINIYTYICIQEAPLHVAEPSQKSLRLRAPGGSTKLLRLTSGFHRLLLTPCTLQPLACLPMLPPGTLLCSCVGGWVGLLSSVCMHACMHTYTRTYIHTCVCIYVHAYTHTCLQACIHTYIHTYKTLHT